MKSSKHRFSLRGLNRLTSFFAVFLLVTPVFAQQHEPYAPEQQQVSKIRWYAKFPDGKQKEVNVLEKIGEFFFGKKEEKVLSKPISVYAKSPEQFWVLDQGLGVMLKIQEGVGEIPHSFHNHHSSLVGICALPDGRLLFTESRKNKVFVLASPDAKKLLEFCPDVELSQPTGIAYSQKNSEIWVVETVGHRIAVFDENGQLLRRLGHRGNGPLEFNYPTFLWIDEDGMVFVVDAMNFRVQILSSDGEFVNVFGEIGDATGYFSRPKGIATDSHGNIYVVDALFHAVQIFDKEGNFLYYFGGQGRADGEFWLPTGIYIDENDFIYVADSYNSRIQIFQYLNGGTNGEDEK